MKKIATGFILGVAALGALEVATGSISNEPRFKKESLKINIEGASLMGSFTNNGKLYIMLNTQVRGPQINVYDLSTRTFLGYLTNWFVDEKYQK
jgi:hypothetical protein